MRVLLSGWFNPRFEALPDYLVEALRRLGHEVLVFDHRSFVFPGRLRQSFPLLERFDRKHLNARLLDLVRSCHPEVLIVNQGMVLTRRTIEEARDLGARCVNWFSDFPAEHEIGLTVADAYDAFYLGSSFAMLRHREAGHRQAHWLPFACDPITHHPDGPKHPVLQNTTEENPARGEREPSVVFVGSHYPERQILLRFLRGLPVGIWGPGWERALGDPHVAPMIRGSALRPAAWRGIFARCRVALNIHYGCFGPLEVSGDLANTRVFEILGCGAYQVVDRQGDVLRLFREGVHLAAFSTGEELRARVEEALRDDDLRNTVATRGLKEVLENHTYVHRARHLLEVRAASLAPVTGRSRETHDPRAESLATGRSAASGSFR